MAIEAVAPAEPQLPVVVIVAVCVKDAEVSVAAPVVAFVTEKMLVLCTACTVNVPE